MDKNIKFGNCILLLFIILSSMVVADCATDTTEASCDWCYLKNSRNQDFCEGVCAKNPDIINCDKCLTDDEYIGTPFCLGYPAEESNEGTESEEELPPVEVCAEKWECPDWDTCLSDVTVLTRSCTCACDDDNDCVDKQEETFTCSTNPTFDEDIKENQNVVCTVPEGYFLDSDGDGFGDYYPLEECNPDGYVNNNYDCNDADAEYKACQHTFEYLKTCEEIKKKYKYGDSGIYAIEPVDGVPNLVYCDMENEWTILNSQLYNVNQFFSLFADSNTIDDDSEYLMSTNGISFKEWFLGDNDIDGDVVFALSPDCKSVNEDSELNKAYYIDTNNNDEVIVDDSNLGNQYRIPVMKLDGTSCIAYKKVDDSECVASIEYCDGEDNNCNDLVDEECVIVSGWSPVLEDDVQFNLDSMKYVNVYKERSGVIKIVGNLKIGKSHLISDPVSVLKNQRYTASFDVYCTEGHLDYKILYGSIYSGSTAPGLLNEWQSFLLPIETSDDIDLTINFITSDNYDITTCYIDNAKVFLGETEATLDALKEVRDNYREDSCCPSDYCFNGSDCVKGLYEPFNYIKYAKGDDVESSSYDADYAHQKYAYSTEFGFDVDNTFDMYVCKNTIPVDEDGEIIPEEPIVASWEKAYYKETWDGTIPEMLKNNDNDGIAGYSINAYCLSDSQCFTGVECVDSGWYTDFDSEERMSVGEIGNPTSFNGDHYCEDGSWTTRTKLLAERLLFLAEKSGSIEDYSLYCGPYSGDNSVLNNIEVYPGVKSILDGISSENNGNGVNNFCVLKYHADNNDNVYDVYDVALGVSLNEHIWAGSSSFLSIFEESDNICNGVRNDFDDLEYSDIYSKCSSEKYWYNVKTMSFIYSKIGIDSALINPNEQINILTIFSNILSNPLEVMMDLIRNYMRPVIKSGILGQFEEIENVKNFNVLYSAAFGEEKVLGVDEYVNPTLTSMSIKFAGFNADLCEAILKYYKENDMVISNIRCEPTISDDTLVYQVHTSNSILFNDWKEISGKLRLEEKEVSSVTLSEPVIISPKAESVYQISSNPKNSYSQEMLLLAAEDLNVMSYYWDIQSDDVINGQFFGKEFVMDDLSKEGNYKVTLIAIGFDGKYLTSSVDICVDDVYTLLPSCVSDIDNDDIDNADDNCPMLSNKEQENIDLLLEEYLGYSYRGIDQLGDACDPDIDGDGVLNEDDKDPEDPAVCSDIDGDGCDDCGAISWHLEGGNFKVTQRYIDVDVVRPYDDDINKGSESGIDTDNDGYCDSPVEYPDNAPNTDTDDDGDNVLDINDCEKDYDDPLVCLDGGKSYSLISNQCGDRDYDECDDCAQELTFDEDNYEVGQLIINDGIDLDRDGECDFNDAFIDTDNDGVANNNPFELNNDDNFQICGDRDYDGCDDCSGLNGQTQFSDLYNGIVYSISDSEREGYESAPDFDGDGKCDNTYVTDLSVPNLDKDMDDDGVNDILVDGYGLLDAYPKNPIRCGDLDNDGCDDCSAVGTNGVTERKVEIDGKYIVRSSEFGGSEKELDYDNDGICDDFDGVPPRIREDTIPSKIYSLTSSLTLYFNEKVECSYTYDNEVTELAKDSFISIEEDFNVDVQSKLTSCISGADSDDKDFYNFIFGIAHMQGACNTISVPSYKDKCNDIVNIQRAYGQNSLDLCNLIINTELKTACVNMVNGDLSEVCGTDVVCEYAKSLNEDELPCDSMSESEYKSICKITVNSELIPVLSAEDKCPSLADGYSFKLDCNDMSLNDMEPYTLNIGLGDRIDLRELSIN